MSPIQLAVKLLPSLLLCDFTQQERLYPLSPTYRRQLQAKRAPFEGDRQGTLGSDVNQNLDRARTFYHTCRGLI